VTPPSRLAASVQAFYDANAKFHRDIATLIDDFAALLPQVPQAERAKFTLLLDPYKKLVSNPFVANATGHVENDLKSILTIVNEDNDQFLQALKAMRECIANLTEMKSDIKRLSEDAAFALKIKEIAIHPIRLEMKMDLALKHLVRYELLLVAIKSELLKAGYQPTDQALQMVLSSLEAVVPEVKNINQYEEVYSLLNRASRVVHELLTLESHQVTMAHIMWPQAINKHDMLLAIVDTIENHKNYIASGGEDVHLLMRGLLGVLQGLADQYPSVDYVHYVASWVYQAAVSPLSFFGGRASSSSPVPANPIDALKGLVEELKEIVKFAEMFAQIKEKRQGDASITLR